MNNRIKEQKEGARYKAKYWLCAKGVLEATASVTGANGSFVALARLPLADWRWGRGRSYIIIIRPKSTIRLSGQLLACNSFLRKSLAVTKR